MNPSTGEFGRSHGLFREVKRLVPVPPRAPYRGFDRRKRGSAEMTAKSARRLQLRVALAACVVIGASFGFYLLTFVVLKVVNPLKIDAIADMTETAFMLFATLAAVSALIAKRLTGHVEPMFFGVGVALTFVLSPLAYGVPPAFHHIDTQWIETSSVIGTSMLVIGVALMALAPLWPQVDSKFSLLRLLLVIAVGIGGLCIILSVFAGIDARYIPGMSPVMLGSSFAGEPAPLNDIAGAPWLALAALYLWRGRLPAGSRRAWTGASFALIGAAFYGHLTVPAGPSAGMLEAFLVTGGQILLLVGSVSALDVSLEVNERELREAETARKSLEISQEASSESSQRYLHDLRSSVAGVSLLLESLATEKTLLFDVTGRGASRADELIKAEVRKMRAMARKGPSIAEFDLGETLGRWVRERGAFARITFDIPVEEIVSAPRELLLDVLALLMREASWCANGGEAPEVLMRAKEAGERVFLEVRWAGAASGSQSEVHQTAAERSLWRWQVGQLNVSPVLLEACVRALGVHGAEMWPLEDGVAFALQTASGIGKMASAGTQG